MPSSNAVKDMHPVGGHSSDVSTRILRYLPTVLTEAFGSLHSVYRLRRELFLTHPSRV